MASRRRNPSPAWLVPGILLGGGFVVAAYVMGKSAGARVSAPAPLPGSAPGPAPVTPLPLPGQTSQPRLPCTTVIVDSFHLRPTVTLQSTGPSYPAGTTVTVLGATTLVRGVATLHRVRVGPTEGFAFVTPAELAACTPLQLA